jgi:hypothetical protein
MADEIKSNAIDVEVFTGIEGSQTSADGQGFALHARREDGRGVMLVFPHTEISNIVENAAMQLAHGRQEDGLIVATAFITSSFNLGHGPQGETVLTLAIGECGNISFLLPTDMAGQLHEALGKLAVRH